MPGAEPLQPSPPNAPALQAEPSQAPMAGEAPVAPAAPVPPASPEPNAGSPPQAASVWGSNAWGGQGALRVDAARSEGRVGLTATAFAETYYFHGLLQAGDRAWGNRTALAVAWQAIDGLQVGLSGSLLTTQYASFGLITRHVLGNPMVHAKYEHGLSDAWRLGVALHALVPSAVASSTLVPRAGVARGSALLTYQPVRPVSLSLNVGYELNRSRYLVAPVTPEKRFVLGIDAANRLAYGLAVEGRLNLGPLVRLGLFAETTGFYTPGLALGDDLARATAGGKIFVGKGELFEAMVAADARLAGAPSAAATWAGIPPWQVLALVSVHFSLLPAEKVAVEQTCEVDGDCSGGRLCRNHLCTVVVVEQVLVAAPEQVFFHVVGRVVDENSSEPVRDAELRVSGFEGQTLAANHRTGEFVSWPIPAGDGQITLKATAPDYAPAEVTLPRPKADTQVKMTVLMHRSDQVAQGTIRGTVTDARTGAKIACQVVVAALGKNLASPTGDFEMVLKPGVYDVLLAAHDYLTQRKRIRVDEGDLVILNVELRPATGKEGKATKALKGRRRRPREPSP